MQNINRRVAALETRARAADTSLKLIFQDDGETRADALKRAGYPPDAADVMLVMFVSPTDLRI